MVLSWDNCVLQYTDNLVLGGVLVFVVVVTGCFTYYQENKSTRCSCI